MHPYERHIWQWISIIGAVTNTCIFREQKPYSVQFVHHRHVTYLLHHSFTVVDALIINRIISSSYLIHFQLLFDGTSLAALLCNFCGILDNVSSTPLVSINGMHLKNVSFGMSLLLSWSDQWQCLVSLFICTSVVCALNCGLKCSVLVTPWLLRVVGSLARGFLLHGG